MSVTDSRGKFGRTSRKGGVFDVLCAFKQTDGGISQNIHQIWRFTSGKNNLLRLHVGVWLKMNTRHVLMRREEEYNSIINLAIIMNASVY